MCIKVRINERGSAVVLDGCLHQFPGVSPGDETGILHLLEEAKNDHARFCAEEDLHVVCPGS